jgi:hypothetical protein
LQRKENRVSLNGLRGAPSGDLEKILCPVAIVLRHLARVKEKSLPMQDEPERRTGFQYKMSLKN